MQKKDSNFQPLGICHRLFNFIMNNLLAPGLRRPLPQEPVEGSSRTSTEQNRKPGEETQPNPDQGKPKSHSGSEVMIESRHANGSDHWTQKDGPLCNAEKEKLVAEHSGKGQELKSPHGKGAKKTISIKESTEAIEKREKNKKKIQTEKLAPPPPSPPTEDGEVIVRHPKMPLLGNINAKSDEFIRKKRADLSRITSL